LELAFINNPETQTNQNSITSVEKLSSQMNDQRVGSGLIDSNFFFNILETKEAMEDEPKKKRVSSTKQREDFANNLRKEAISAEITPEEKVGNFILRQKLPIVWHMYDFATVGLEYYLPPWKAKVFKPKWATQKYFEGVLTGKSSAIKKGKVKKPSEKFNQYH